jgi:hypothetical protein
MIERSMIFGMILARPAVPACAHRWGRISRDRGRAANAARRTCQAETSRGITSGRDSVANIPDGVAGIETMIPVVLSEGVRGGHLSLNQFVRLTSTNSARPFDLYPQKGTIAVGSDTDLVINRRIDDLQTPLSVDLLRWFAAQRECSGTSRPTR